MAGKGGKDTPMGYGPPVVGRFGFTLSSWAAKEENQKAWKEIMEASGGNLTHDPFEDIEANFTYGDGALIRGACLGMNRARRLGWTGFVDSIEAVHEMYSVSCYRSYFLLVKQTADINNRKWVVMAKEG